MTIMHKIPLTGGYVALVDEKNVIKLSKYHWSTLFSNKGPTYAYDASRGVMMHNIIMNPDEGMFVDHIDRDGLNNLECNLRIGTLGENLMNKVKYFTYSTSSRFKGVDYYSKYRKWRARISYLGTTVHLGYFDTEYEAALAYDKKAIQFYGKFAVLNLQEVEL